MHKLTSISIIIRQSAYITRATPQNRNCKQYNTRNLTITKRSHTSSREKVEKPLSPI